MVWTMGEAGVVNRLLAVAGTDAPEVAEYKLRSLRRLVLLVVGCESWYALGFIPYSSRPALYGAAAAALTICAVLGWRDRFAWPAVCAAFLLELSIVLSAFPDNANHQYLLLVFLTLLILVGRPSEAVASDSLDTACLQAVRWIIAIGLAWAGLMKLVYGYWFGAEFLSFRIATDPGFAWVLGAFVPDGEMARLTLLENRVGAGPFRVEAPMLIAISNITWLVEIVVPIGLLWSRTRGVSIVVALALMVAIQLGAREVFFAGLMIGGLLLFARRDRLAAFLPVLGVFYLFWLLRPQWVDWLGAGAGP